MCRIDFSYVVSARHETKTAIDLHGRGDDALASFRKAERTTKLLGEDVKGRYADLKQAAADRCPRLLGTFVKAPEVQYHHDVYNQFLWNLF
jgi:glutamine synthetase